MLALTARHQRDTGAFVFRPVGLYEVPEPAKVAVATYPVKPPSQEIKLKLQ